MLALFDALSAKLLKSSQLTTNGVRVVYWESVLEVVLLETRKERQEEGGIILPHCR